MMFDPSTEVPNFKRFIFIVPLVCYLVDNIFRVELIFKDMSFMYTQVAFRNNRESHGRYWFVASVYLIILFLPDKIQVILWDKFYITPISTINNFLSFNLCGIIAKNITKIWSVEIGKCSSGNVVSLSRHFQPESLQQHVVLVPFYDN